MYEFTTAVAPTTIHHHVKTVREQLRNLHYFAPEYQYSQQQINTGVDVYAFGVCALEVKCSIILLERHVLLCRWR